MEIYIFVSMIMNILGIGIILHRFNSYDYGIPKLQSKGGDLFACLMSLGFVIWAGTLVL